MKEFNLSTFGYRMSLCIDIGRFVAYTVNDEEYDYYDVKVDQKPEQVKKTQVVKLEGEEFAVTEGEWICYGSWLGKVPNTNMWWYQTKQRCFL